MRTSLGVPPDDEEDEIQVSQIKMNVHQFAAGMVRIANMVVIQLGAETEGAEEGGT